MDGNGRWAQARGLPRFVGHQRGLDAVRRTVVAAKELGIDFLTLYSFSTENWNRPTEEVSLLMGLLRRFIRTDVADLHARGVRVRVIGRRADLQSDIAAALAEAEALTAQNQGLTLTVAFNYGSRQEIVDAARCLAEWVVAGKILPQDIGIEHFAQALQSCDIPDPDLIIRTSGEQRLSNFLLWQAAYSELVFLPLHWPDFDRAALQTALDMYHARDRRYGGRGALGDATIVKSAS